jgi:hypothetical protein
MPLNEIDYDDTFNHISDTARDILLKLNNRSLDKPVALAQVESLKQTITTYIDMSDILLEQKSNYISLELTIKLLITHISNKYN